jgi:hypothetical protein
MVISPNHDSMNLINIGSDIDMEVSTNHFSIFLFIILLYYSLMPQYLVGYYFYKSIFFLTSKNTTIFLWDEFYRITNSYFTSQKKYYV